MPSHTSRQLARRVLDRRLAPVRALVVPTPPRGWIRAIRESLGMSLADLGRRMDVSRQAAAQIELGEADGSIRLDTLRRAADALGCDLFYALVPRSSLDATVVGRAREVAAADAARTLHTMALEAQSGGEDDVERLIDELADAAIITPRRLWRD